MPASIGCTTPTLPRRGSASPNGGRCEASCEDAIGYLSHLTHLATRLVLFAVNERWTAMLNNLRNGSDFVDEQRWVTRRAEARTCRVLDKTQPYPARLFALAASDGTTVRSVHCMLDGNRWDFGLSREPLPAEAAFDYTARRKRDRFTSANLQELLASMDVTPSVPEAFGAAERFVLLTKQIKVRERHAKWRPAPARPSRPMTPASATSNAAAAGPRTARRTPRRSCGT
jgi:hypothetical protein